jgi:hypothetical protein
MKTMIYGYFGRFLMEKAIISPSTTADVAQLVESQIVILVVAGSSPVVRPTKYLKSSQVELFLLQSLL